MEVSCSPYIDVVSVSHVKKAPAKGTHQSCTQCSTTILNVAPEGVAWLSRQNEGRGELGLTGRYVGGLSTSIGRTLKRAQDILGFSRRRGRCGRSRDGVAKARCWCRAGRNLPRRLRRATVGMQENAAGFRKVGDYVESSAKIVVSYCH